MNHEQYKALLMESKFKQLVSNHDTLFALDELGQVWKLMRIAFRDGDYNDYQYRDEWRPVTMNRNVPDAS